MLTDLYERILSGAQVAIWPSRGSNAVPIAFNPDTGLVYTSAWHVPRIVQLEPPQERVIGGRAIGMSSRFPNFEPGELLGHLVAIDPLTGEKKWEVPMIDFPNSAGMLATGGGLVFTGNLTGEFVALDAATGETLVAVPDRLEHQFHSDYLHPRRPAVRQRGLRTRRRPGQPLRAGQGADRRLAVYLRADAGIAAGVAGCGAARSEVAGSRQSTFLSVGEVVLLAAPRRSGVVRIVCWNINRRADACAELRRMDADVALLQGSRKGGGPALGRDHP